MTYFFGETRLPSSLSSESAATRKSVWDTRQGDSSFVRSVSKITRTPIQSGYYLVKGFLQI